MARTALVLAALLLLLPIISANVGKQTYYTPSMSYRCAAQGVNWQYLHGDIQGTVDAKVEGPLSPNGNNGEIGQNEDVCWQSGAKIKVTPYAGGEFAIEPSTWRGYIGHPPVAWLGGITSPPYSTATTYSSPSICRVSSASATTLNAFLELYPSLISYIKSTNIQSDFSPPCWPVPTEWCYCEGLLSYDGTLLQGAPPPVPPYPPSWLSCQSGTGDGIVICKGEARIYETTTGSDVLKATVPMEGTGAQAEITLAQQEIAISSPGIKKFRTDLYIDECGVYSVSDLGTPRFYRDSYPLLDNVLLQGTELTFNAMSCASCTVVADSPSSASCSPTAHDFTFRVNYANVPAGSSIRLVPDLPGTPSPKLLGPISGTGEITPHSLTAISYTSTGGTYNIFGKMTIPGFATDQDCTNPATVQCTVPPPPTCIVKSKGFDGNGNVMAYIEYYNAEPDTTAYLYCDGTYSDPDYTLNPVGPEIVGTGNTWDKFAWSPPPYCPNAPPFKIAGRLAWFKGMALATADCEMLDINERSCSLSVVPPSDSDCSSGHTFDIQLEHYGVQPGDKVVIDGGPEANPPFYELSKPDLDLCPPGWPFCIRPFTYTSLLEKYYPITAQIQVNGWGGPPTDIIDCTPPTQVHCNAGPSCSLSVDGPSSADCTGGHAFKIDWQFSDVPIPIPPDTNYYQGVILSPSGNPPQLGPNNIVTSPDSGSYSPEYNAPGTYVIEGQIRPPGSVNPVATCTATVQCIAPGQQPCEDYI